MTRHSTSPSLELLSHGTRVDSGESRGAEGSTEARAAVAIAKAHQLAPRLPMPSPALPPEAPLPDRTARCLILAAGRGSRLHGEGDCKPLLRVGGLPLIERTIMSAHRAGLTDFYVVTGHEAPRLEAFLAELAQRRGLAITPLRCPDWSMGNAASLLTAREVLDTPFALLMADHLFDEAILTDLVATPLGDAGVRLAVDFQRDDHPRIDAAEATKVHTAGDKIVAIGKQLEHYEGYDSGIFLCAPAIFAAAEASVASGDGSLSHAISALAADGRARTHDLGTHVWLDVDTPADRKQAEIVLRDQLSKPADGWVARRLNRPFSRRVFTPLLLRVLPSISPNQVSLLSFAVALGAALAFALRQPILGAVAIQVASVLDGSDGEIARLKKLESPFGGMLDAVLDRYSDSFVLAGMAYFAWDAAANARLFGEALPALIAVTAILAISGTLLVSYTSAKAASDLGYRYRGRWIAAGRGRDWRVFLLFVAGLLTVVHPVSVVVALGLLAVVTNAIVVRRLQLSARRARRLAPVSPATTQAVIFDLDGTLADTMPLLTGLAVDLFTRHYGLDAADARSRYYATSGLDFASQVAELFPGQPANREVVAAFEAAKRQAILEQPLFPDTLDALRALQAQGVKRYLVSSTDAATVAAYARRHALDGWFDGLQGLTPGRAKGDQLAVVLAAGGLRPDEVVFVGDALRDGDFSHTAGIPFLGVQRHLDAQAFRARGFESVPDLSALVPQLRESRP